MGQMQPRTDDKYEKCEKEKPIEKDRATSSKFGLRLDVNPALKDGWVKKVKNPGRPT